MDKIYEQFPKLQDRVNFYADHPELVNLDQPEQSCINMQMCSKFDLMEALSEEMPLDLSSHIETVNSDPRSTWTAGVNAKFEGASLKEIKNLMGTVVDPDWTVKSISRGQARLVADDTPAEFDARTNWPECESVINHVRDQSNCGSCWAHGTTEALNDRICISTGGNFTTLLSVSDTTACCDGDSCFSFGCNGG